MFSSEMTCIDTECDIPLHSKIGYNFSVYGITQGGVIFVADMMTFSNNNFLPNLVAIDETIEHFDCSTATVHFVFTNERNSSKKNVNFFIIDAPKGRIILPACNWTIYNDILYCEIYWPAAKFERIRSCYMPKYYYARKKNKVYYLCHDSNDSVSKTLFIDEGLKLILQRYGYKRAVDSFNSLNEMITADYLGQIITVNDAQIFKQNWLLTFQREDELEPNAKRLLSCIVENKIRYVLQTMLAQFCIFEHSILSFRMTAQLLPNNINKTTLTRFLKYNELDTLPIKSDNLSINVLPLIISRQV
uniref:Uncharacterized protein n=1 Tax=Setaria digitata TaxID=48799 RepID=A0A915Q3Q4_9BILA